MTELYRTEGEMLPSKVNEALNSLREAYRAANPKKCDEFENTLMEYFQANGFGNSMGYFVEKVHASWFSPESASMKFPGPGCLHLTESVVSVDQIKEFIGKLADLTLDPDGYLTGPLIFWSWKEHSWWKPAGGNFAAMVEVEGLDPMSMPFDWCLLFCGTNLCLYLWGSRVSENT